MIWQRQPGRRDTWILFNDRGGVIAAIRETQDRGWVVTTQEFGLLNTRPLGAQINTEERAKGVVMAAFLDRVEKPAGGVMS